MVKLDQLEQNEDDASELEQINQSSFGKDLNFSYIDEEDALDD